MSSKDQNRKVGIAFAVAISAVLILSVVLLLNSQSLIEWILRWHGLQFSKIAEEFTISAHDYSNFVRTILELVSASLGVVLLLVFSYYVINKRQEESIVRTETTQKIDLINQIFSESAALRDHKYGQVLIPTATSCLSQNCTTDILSEQAIPVELNTLRNQLAKNLDTLNAAKANIISPDTGQFSYLNYRSINGIGEAIIRYIDPQTVDSLLSERSEDIINRHVVLDGTQYDWICNLSGESSSRLLGGLENNSENIEINVTYALLIDRAFLERVTSFISKTFLILRSSILTRDESILLLDSLNAILINHQLWIGLLHRAIDYRMRGLRMSSSMTPDEKSVFPFYTVGRMDNSHFSFSRELREYVATIYLKIILEQPEATRRLRWTGLLCRSSVFEFFIKNELKGTSVVYNQGLFDAYSNAIKSTIAPMLLDLKIDSLVIKQKDIEICNRQVLAYYFVIRRLAHSAS